MPPISWWLFSSNHHPYIIQSLIYIINLPNLKSSAIFGTTKLWMCLASFHSLRSSLHLAVEFQYGPYISISLFFSAGSALQSYSGILSSNCENSVVGYLSEHPGSEIPLHFRFPDCVYHQFYLAITISWKFHELCFQSLNFHSSLLPCMIYFIDNIFQSLSAIITLTSALLILLFLWLLIFSSMFSILGSFIIWLTRTLNSLGESGQLRLTPLFITHFFGYSEPNFTFTLWFLQIVIINILINCSC